MFNFKILFISLIIIIFSLSMVYAQVPSIKMPTPKVTQLASSSSQCCGQYNNGRTGNINCSENGSIDLGDITKLIDYIFVSHSPLCCEANGNINGDGQGKVNIADMLMLIRHVYPKSIHHKIRPTARCR